MREPSERRDTDGRRFGVEYLRACNRRWARKNIARARTAVSNDIAAALLCMAGHNLRRCTHRTLADRVFAIAKRLRLAGCVP